MNGVRAPLTFKPSARDRDVGTRLLARASSMNRRAQILKERSAALLSAAPIDAAPIDEASYPEASYPEYEVRAYIDGYFEPASEQWMLR